MKKKHIIGFVILCLACFGIGALIGTVAQEDTPEEVLARIESALGDEFKKQTMTEVAATIQYSDGEGNEINYHILKTTYYEADPSEVEGLNINALGILFAPEFAESCREMMVQEWHGALYEMGERSYLCWTYSPEISYVLEYDPEAVPEDEIIKMAESARFSEDETAEESE